MTTARPTLCPIHTDHRTKWNNLHYSARKPTEWPGGSIIMDNRTSHADRAADWARKTAEQIKQVETLCLSGTSAQCNR